MAMTRREVIVALAAGCALAASLARGDEPSQPATRLDLTRESFGRLHALIRPHAHEWRHLNVNWLTDVVAARKKAAAEDKPIVICYTGGAGYNEPLGVC
jgi:hypothetical protein